MLFEKMLSAITPHLPIIRTHPFNLGLLDGSLPKDVFTTFLEQDRLYLNDFSRALMQTGQRLAEARHQQLFQRLSDDGFEFDLYVKYLLKSQTPTWFKPIELPAHQNSVVNAYTSYLITNANEAPVEIAVASLIPCYYIYSHLGLHMRATLKPNNPYHLWINTYSDEHFLSSTKQIIQVATELAPPNNSIAEKNMIAAFVKSTEFEISFWDCMYKPAVEQKMAPNDSVDIRI